MSITVKSILALVKKQGFNILLILFLFYVLSQKIPSIWNMYKTENTKAPVSTVLDLSGQMLSLPLPQPHILVFWATWCGPCKIELGRINNLILSGDLSADSVLAISIGEDPSLVSSFVNQEQYKFKVAVDPANETSDLYQIKGTPTLFLINENQVISWMTTGLSPTLEFRIKSFIPKVQP